MAKISWLLRYLSGRTGKFTNFFSQISDILTPTVFSYVLECLFEIINMKKVIKIIFIVIGVIVIWFFAENLRGTHHYSPLAKFMCEIKGEYYSHWRRSRGKTIYCCEKIEDNESDGACMVCW